MDAHAPSRDSFSQPITLTRRTVLGFPAALGLGIAMDVRASARTQDAAPPAPFEGDAFVGVTDLPDLFVAVVIGVDEARGYLCDGSSLITWCTGPATEPLTLTSADGATLTATWQNDALAGSATLADGATVRFTATAAIGIAGLYEVVVDADGHVVGAAAGDLRLEAVVAGTLPDGTLLVAGAVALPEGGLRPLAVFATPDAAGVQRWIVRDDGRVTGGFKRGEGSGFIDPVSDLAVPKDKPIIDGTSNT